METINEEEARKLWNALNAASRDINKGKTGDNGAEQAYSTAYHRLVVAGLVPKLRERYR